MLKKEDALFDNKEAMSNGIENFFKTQVTAVSYTHLDVYKRQTKSCSPKRKCCGQNDRKNGITYKRRSSCRAEMCIRDSLYGFPLGTSERKAEKKNGTGKGENDADCRS